MGEYDEFFEIITSLLLINTGTLFTCKLFKQHRTSANSIVFLNLLNFVCFLHPFKTSILHVYFIKFDS